MNKKWESIDIWNFTNSGHYDFAMNIAAEAKKIPAIMERCTPEVTALEAAVHEEDESLIHAAKSKYTKDLWDNDKIRDERYVNVSELTRAFMKWPETMPQRGAAERVLETLDLYNVRIRAQINKETGAMTNLLQILQGERAADIQTLGLTDIVTEMAEANEEVNRIYNDRLWADSVKITGRVKKARAEVDKCYMALREKVNALVIVFGAEPYSPFIGYVNQRILEAKRRQFGQKKQTTVVDEEVTEDVEEEVTEEEGKPENKPNETPNEGENGENNENTEGNQPEQENPNQPPPPTGGGESGFDW